MPTAPLPPPTLTTTGPDAAALRLRWVMRLRWAGIAAQVLIVLSATSWLAADQLRALAVVAAGVCSNAAVDLWLRRRPIADQGPPRVLVAAILVDILLLTVLLAFTGGPLNPFTLFYVVHVATATVALSRRGSWAVAVVAAASYGVLFLPGVFDAEAHMHQMHGPGFFAHVRGMWIAFSITAAFIVLFLGQLRHALEEREQRVRDQQAARSRELRLASLATLAGGAAHELATPLSTIALVAESLAGQLPADATQECRDDVALLGAEVQRCMTVLQQLSVDAGTPGGEHPVPTPMTVLIDEMCRHTHPVLVVDDAIRAVEVLAPTRALGSALRGLVKNAEQVATSKASLAVQVTASEVTITVGDDGPFIDDETLQRLGEPFFTTKAVGDGMGLGVFLARTVVEQCGGSLSYARRDRGAGLIATVTLPRWRPT